MGAPTWHDLKTHWRFSVPQLSYITQHGCANWGHMQHPWYVLRLCFCVCVCVCADMHSAAVCFNPDEENIWICVSFCLVTMSPNMPFILSFRWHQQWVPLIFFGCSSPPPPQCHLDRPSPDFPSAAQLPKSCRWKCFLTTQRRHESPRYEKKSRCIPEKKMCRCKSASHFHDLVLPLGGGWVGGGGCLRSVKLWIIMAEMTKKCCTTPDMQ